MLAEVLREVPAVRHDGVLVLVPHGRFGDLQLLVRRLPVKTADKRQQPVIVVFLKKKTNSTSNLESICYFSLPLTSEQLASLLMHW